MKLKQLLEQLNQLAEEKPEALEMEVLVNIHTEDDYTDIKAHKLQFADIQYIKKKPCYFTRGNPWKEIWDEFKAFEGEDRASNNKNTTGAILLQPSRKDLKPLKAVENFKPYD